uniref:AP complex mu/sigma subunit domain-containing protein n=1 Tax=Timema tahoe TaxID=61484 RepID=A0A7R9FLG4_9NEOP|nr:unnamed protein product [Timema tahoe]
MKSFISATFQRSSTANILIGLIPNTEWFLGCEQMQFMLLFSRQGKLRLQKWYVAHPDKLKKKITRELITTILARKPKMSSFLEWKDVKVVYKRSV